MRFVSVVKNGRRYDIPIDQLSKGEPIKAESPDISVGAIVSLKGHKGKVLDTTGDLANVSWEDASISQVNIKELKYEGRVEKMTKGGPGSGVYERHPKGDRTPEQKAQANKDAEEYFKKHPEQRQVGSRDSVENARARDEAYNKIKEEKPSGIPYLTFEEVDGKASQVVKDDKGTIRIGDKFVNGNGEAHDVRDVYAHHPADNQTVPLISVGKVGSKEFEDLTSEEFRAKFPNKAGWEGANFAGPGRNAY